MDIKKIVSTVKIKLDNIEYSKKEIAQYIHFINKNELYEELNYHNIYDFCENIFGLKKRTTQFYLDVIQKYYTFSCEFSDTCVVYVLKKTFYRDFTFSQLKTLLSVSYDDVIMLGIKPDMTVRQIEQIIHKYKKSVNNIQDEDNEDDNTQDLVEEEHKIFSFSDKEENKKAIENDFIPLNSDYEIVFRNNDNCLKKNSHQMRNVNTTIKHLRTMIEENTEDMFYYAVVKIPIKEFK